MELVLFFLVPIAVIGMGVFLLRGGFTAVSPDANRNFGWLMIAFGTVDLLFRMLRMGGVIR
jgi:hypothetical protein